MSRIFFEEKQKLPSWVRWLVAFASVGAVITILRLLYFNTVLGSDPANESTSVLIVSFIFVLVSGAVATWLISSMYLEVKIDDEGVYVRYYPHQREVKLEKKNISGFEVRKMQAREYFMAKRGRKFGQHGRHQVYSMNGNQVVELQLTTGEKIVLGTGNAGSLAWAMKKLLSQA